MDTARCRAFVAAAKSGSFSKAAEELNYTTSAVSQLITALEEALKVTLFFRSRKGVTLTADGERMYPVIYNFVRQEDLIWQTAADIRGLLVGEIVIAAYPSLCVAWLTDIIRQFNRKYPNIRFQLDDSIRHYVLEALNAGRADIGFLSNQHDFSGEWVTIENNPIVAVVSHESKYAKLDAFPIEECGRADLIQSSYGKDRDRARCAGSGRYIKTEGTQDQEPVYDGKRKTLPVRRDRLRPGSLRKSEGALRQGERCALRAHCFGGFLCKGRHSGSGTEGLRLSLRTPAGSCGFCGYGDRRL